MKSLVRMFRFSLLAVLLATTAFSAKPITQAYALGTTFIVNTEEAGLDNSDGLCSYSEALANANFDNNDQPNCPQGTGDDTIAFADGIGMITLTQYSGHGNLFHITDPDGLTIDGGGDVTIHGAYNYQLFYVDQDASLTLKNLILAGGYAAGGGAVYNNAGSLTVINSVFYFNNAQYGGAIYNHYGTLKVANSLFLENLSSDDGVIKGGAIYVGGGSVTLTNNTFHLNRAQESGDFYAADGTVRLYNNIFADSLNGGHCATVFGVDINGHNNLFEDAATACGLTNGVNGNLLGVDPAFDSTNFYGIALLSTSQAIDAGNNDDCTAAPVSNTSLNGLLRPHGLRCDIGAYEYPQTLALATLFSSSVRDGWVLESKETSGIGGTKNTTATTVRIGDDAQNRQYRAVFSFDTSGFAPPSTAIVAAELWVHPAGVVGTSPFLTHAKLLADLHTGDFSNDQFLQPRDFQAVATRKGLVIPKTLNNGWYRLALNSADFQYINRTGLTQIRLRFTKDDNNDFGADFLKINSSNGDATWLPRLILYYYVR